jgi:hypothetical protein
VIFFNKLESIFDYISSNFKIILELFLMKLFCYIMYKAGRMLQSVIDKSALTFLLYIIKQIQDVCECNSYAQCKILL